ncbi:hypothetical protein BH18GEM1_BH18GEM1_14030 [soil metagenome]
MHREDADVATVDGQRFQQEVEPLASYFVGRIKQDFGQGDLQVGGMITSVTRNFEDSALEDLLASHSEVFGLDAEAWWNDRNYHFLASGAISNVSGSTDAIRRVQARLRPLFARGEGGGRVAWGSSRPTRRQKKQ